MKRLAEEIVDEAMSKDERGNFFHPVMGEPLVMTFFGAADALYEVLAEKPGIALNLIMTNKALEAFWTQFQGTWIAWMDLLIEKEMSPYAKEIYPFFVIQNRRVASLCGHKATALENIVDLMDYKRGDNVPRGFFMEYINYRMATPKETDVYYVAYHDPVTELYFDMLDEIDCIEARLERTADSKTTEWRQRYLNTKMNNGYVAILSDCVVVVGDASLKEFDFKYQVSELRAAMPQIIDYLDSLENEPAKIHRGRREAKRLSYRLSALLLDDSLTLEEIKPLKLDKNVAAPYRSLLYDIKQGLFNTSEKQKALFIETIRSIPELNDQGNQREVIIERYGKEIPLSCVTCGQLTMQVDPVRKAAFCNDKCYK